jgi:hypothetical protein
MNKIAVFTQTYENDRQEIFDYKVKDKNFIAFIKNFDSFLSFHNCSDDTINSLKEKQLGYNNYLIYNNINYAETLNITLNKFLDEGYNKFLFLQDDCFSVQKNYNFYDNLKIFLENENYDMISLCDVYSQNLLKDYYECEKYISGSSQDETIVDNIPDKYFFKSYDLLKIYKTNSSELAMSILDNYPPYNDGPFCADIEFFKNILGTNFINQNSVWNLENYLLEKVKHNPIVKYSCNALLFRNSNIIGRNDWNRQWELMWLNERFIEND